MSLRTEFQIEALKAREKNLSVSYSEDKEFTYLSIDGCSMLKIPNRSFLLDKAKLNKVDTLADIFNADTELYKLEDTNYRRLYMPKREAVCFECEISGEKQTVYCDAEELEKLSFKDTEFFTDQCRKTIYLATHGKVYAVMSNRKFPEPEEY